MDMRMGFDKEEVSSLNSRDTFSSKHQLSIASDNNKLNSKANNLQLHGDYIRVETGVGEDDDDDTALDEFDQDDNDLPCCRWWNRNIMEDKSLGWGGSDVIEVSGVKFFKLLIWTYIGIILVHFLVRWLDYEHDENYSLKDMILFDSNLIILDVMTFFMVGRLFHQKGIDHAAWLGIALVASVYASWSKRFSFLRHSFSLYSIHCEWPWQLWIFVAIIVPLSLGVIACHLRYAARENRFKQKVFEFTMGWVFFVFPFVNSPNFHIHHWYACWALGMHANIDTWWSRATMAWCWGMYINGIAVYGRDPVLTCATAFYYSTNQNCSFMECASNNTFVDESAAAAQTNYAEMVVPDWRHCTGYSP